MSKSHAIENDPLKIETDIQVFLLFLSIAFHNRRIILFVDIDGELRDLMESRGSAYQNRFGSSFKQVGKAFASTVQAAHPKVSSA